MSRNDKIMIALAAAAVIVTLAAWQFPNWIIGDSDAETNGQASATRSEPATSTAAPATTSTRSGGIYLDGLTPLSGGASLVPARDRPTAVTSADYPHALVIGCPTNQSDDKVREVTYELRGRYVDLSATVRPHYGKDPEAVTYVTAFGGFRQKDGTMTRRELGTQYFATMNAPKDLAAEVRGAEELTLQVRCSMPDGVIVLESAQLTRS